jgi:hypothetical protein
LPRKKTNPAAAVASSRERMFLLLICAIAGIRVFVFSAAFPFFNNVDERQHFDYVCRCAHLRCIAGLENISSECAIAIATYQSLEYLSPEEECSLKRWAPAWMLNDKELDERMAAAYSIRTGITNSEGVQPPLYYAIAGVWYRLGEVLQFSLFWLRFLNVAILMLTVYLSHLFAKNLYPNRDFLRLGLPLMIALVPQDLFYSISNCTLFALTFGAAFYYLTLICQGRVTNPWSYLLAGLLCSAAVLSGYTNIAVYLLLALTVVLRLKHTLNTDIAAAEIRRLAGMIAAAAVPVGCWIARNYVVLGAPTAAAQFLQHTHWVTKPLLDMFDHPIFTAAGFGTFWRELMTTFFRGELVWHLQPLKTEWADAFYVWSPAVFLICAVVVAVKTGKTDERCVDTMSILAILTSMAVLVVLSIRYDFGNWWGPSRAHPYYSNGRLIYGIMIPFFAMYLSGLDALLDKIKLRRFRYAALAAICVLMLVSEIVTSPPVFRSHFNWFHLIA